jgi:NAD(P)H dehydrogenase (quinone)
MTTASNPTIAIVYHSGYGHTHVLAEAVAAGVAREGATPNLVRIESATQDFTAALEAVSAADGVIFGAPTYMGDISSPLRAFFEATAGIWMKAGWHDKPAGGFTNGLTFGGEKHHSLSSMFVLAMQHGMIWAGPGVPLGNTEGNQGSKPEAANRLGYALGAVAQSDNAAADITPPSGDKEFASLLGARIAGLARRLKK